VKIKKTLALTFREEHWLRVFENRLLPKISVSERNEITEEWRRLHNEELKVLYFSQNIPVFR
jgi:hypothetical protein